jgi:hypothetical protein
MQLERVGDRVPLLPDERRPLLPAPNEFPMTPGTEPADGSEP